MQKAYPNRINWENEPSTSTPLNEDNLNKMDYALYEIDDRVVWLAQYKEDAEQAAQNAQTSAQNSASSASQALASQQAAKASELAAKASEDAAKISELAAKTSEDNARTSETHAAASETRAKTSEDNALDYRKLAESHNHGNTGVREGEDTDNSKYWSEQSQDSATNSQTSAENSATSASEALTSKNQAAEILEQVKSYSEIIIPNFLLDPDDGILYISNDVSGVDFYFEEETGYLYYKFVS